MKKTMRDKKHLLPCTQEIMEKVLFKAINLKLMSCKKNKTNKPYLMMTIVLILELLIRNMMEHLTESIPATMTRNITLKTKDKTQVLQDMNYTRQEKV